VFSTELDAIVAEGRKLARIHRNVVVKVPLIVEGLKAVRRLTAEAIRTNVTLCFSPNQALLAAKAGATYVSPFVGRLDDTSRDGMALIEQILTVYRHYDLSTEVLNEEKALPSKALSPPSRLFGRKSVISPSVKTHGRDEDTSRRSPQPSQEKAPCQNTP
jgi:TalC/MipB family fructose-6-phosphate aldolase